ncbi:AraC family transcriptional regulator [Erysipelotrichaceae bacterium OttesenSCG-928-M19]|nr:AraC family transcriptional regulator [Erysipelotrichaceae bacterium OttesenSCG-928-M19]
MEWSDSISRALTFIENNLDDELTIEIIAKEVMISPFYFQKGFALLCGFTVGEYIKKRRLSLAGNELLKTDIKIIDLALKYGYDSPDSFTKAFTRFHGATPTSVRKGQAMIKSFAPLKIKFSLEGGYTMDYKIVKKDAFKVIGLRREFKYEDAYKLVPQLWQQYYEEGKDKLVNSVYGINIDEKMSGDVFEYMIGDIYTNTTVPEGFITREIPQYTWAVFACKGAMPTMMQETNSKIFSEWLVNNKEYEIAAGYNIEMYSNPSDYPNGVNDDNYYSEIWIPVKQK